MQSTKYDRLTGLYTRDFFFEYLRLIEKSNSDKDMDAVVVYIQHFRLINEIYGKVCGNRMLKQVGDSLKKLLEVLKFNQ